MNKKLLNKIGLYTKKQLEQFVSQQLNNQARYFRDLYQNEQKQRITSIAESLNKLLQANIIDKDEQYLSITPFVDSYNIFYWITTEIPITDKYVNSGKIEVNKCLYSGNNLEGSLEYDIFMDPDEIYKYKIFNKPQYIKIVDFIVKPQNRGIGTHLLQKLDQIAYALKIDFISGFLSPRDYDKRDAQIRFYERNGYTVKSDDQTREGCIRKILKC